MVPSLVGAAFVLGLAGGPHCVAMCGPACAGIARVVVVHGPRPPRRDGALPFHAGRVAGYALAGAAAAQAVDSLAWLSTQAAALRPLWTLLHLAVLGWGLSLLLLGRQPAAVGAAGRRLWGHVRPLAPRIGGAFTVGLLWACMPCGLLYSALLAASLSGGPAAGALSMALFAAGSALSLVLAPRLFAGLRRHGEGQRSQWGARAAGGLVVLAAAWSLWLDVARRVAIWCGYA